MKRLSSVKFKKIAIIFYGLVIITVLSTLGFILSDSIEHKKHNDIIVVSNTNDIQSVDHSIEVDTSALEAQIPEIQEQMPAWRTNAALWKTTQKPKIAIVIDDLGLAEHATDDLSEIIGPFTLAFLPYAERLPLQTKIAKKAGHELMVHLPMEPHSKTADPGPNALLTGLKQEEFERRIHWNLTQFTGFVGVNNHMGSKLTEDPAMMVHLMQSLKESGWIFLDSLTSHKTVAERAAIATGVPTIARDIFLDNNKDKTAIRAQLSKTEKLAQKRGYAIAIGHPYPETIEVLKEWSNDVKARGFSLVPISQLIADKINAEIP